MLEGKKIVIIGGTTGLGLSAAKAFTRHGAQIVVIGRKTESCTLVQQELGDACRAMAADAREESTATQAIELCEQTFGGFDGLYHVAGGSGRRFGDGPLHEMTLEGWNKTLQHNLTSIMLSNRAAVQHWLGQDRAGTLINMSSVLGYSPSPKYFTTHAYAAAKAAIIGYSKAVAAHYATHNIRVHVVAPALVETPMAQRAVQDPAIVRFVQTKQPLDGGRVGRVSDLDGLVTLLMSDQFTFSTGQVFSVDGGWSISEGQY